MSSQSFSKNHTASLSSIKVATWNILNTNFEVERRSIQIAKEIAPFDIVLLQEVVFEKESSTAQDIANRSGLSLVMVNAGIKAHHEHDYGTAVLSRLPIVERFLIETGFTKEKFPNKVEHTHYAGAVLISPSGRHIIVGSVHLPWGAVEARRLEHARAVEVQLQEIASKYPSDSIILIGGDFNSPAESDTLRYLKGLSSFTFAQSAKDIEDKVDPNDRKSTFWVDAWEAVGKGPGHTFDPHMGNANIVNTARLVGIKASNQLLPRRIDYLMIRGWAYGKEGSPLSIAYLGKEPDGGGLHASDHLGLVAAIWDPKE
jgi:endonuclease/exonuclease/phosphatase family metal-dependent hydrolase